MTLFELLAQWRRIAARWDKRGEIGLYSGVSNCADSLEEWLRVHEPVEFERVQQQKEASEQ